MPIDRVQASFFQDAVWADSLAQLVLPDVLERARSARLFRVWSPACGTGEELYSVSLMLATALPDADDWSIFLTGTDTDDAKLTRARRAAYLEGALRTLSREERACYFRYNPNTRRYGLRERFIRNAHFGYRLLDDTTTASPPPGCFELILCPEAVAALPAEQQRAVVAFYGSALSERGVLVAKKPLEGALEAFATSFHSGLFAHYRSDVPCVPSSLPASELPTVRPPAPSHDWPRGYANELSFA
ncbi:MAG: CheR family methyltransferase [Myxococcota bacterium]